MAPSILHIAAAVAGSFLVFSALIFSLPAAESPPGQGGTASATADSEPWCPDWSPEFDHRFQQHCGFWTGAVDRWRANLSASRGAVRYRCSQEHNEKYCNGLGDRFGGLQSALLVALASGRRVGLDWPGLDLVFEPSPCLLGSDAGWSWAGLPSPAAEDCAVARMRGGPVGSKRRHHSTLLTCDFASVSKCYEEPADDQDVVLYNHGRGCTALNTSRHGSWLHPEFDSLCGTLVAAAPPGSAVAAGYPTPMHVFGCPLRLLLSPVPEFLTSRVPWRMSAAGGAGAGAVVVERSLAEIEALMADFFVISMHMRVRSAEHGSRNGEIPDELDPMRPFRCALQIEAEMRNLSAAAGRPMKEVRWVVASDSEWLKRQAAEKFPSKVMMVDLPPEHIAKEHHADRTHDVLKHTFAEWYLLSKGNEAMFNRLFPLGKGVDHAIFPKRGRLSGFSKTLWAYSLRNDFYDPRECVKDHLRFDGTWKQATLGDSCNNVPEPPRAEGSTTSTTSTTSTLHDVEAIFAMAAGV